MRLLGVSGSLREESLNTRLLGSASRVVPADAELEVLEADVLRHLPHYDEDLDLPGLDDPWVTRWRAAVDRADALLFVTPEYNAGLPSAVKNAVDWASRPRDEAVIKGKPAAAISASTGSYGGVWAQDQLRKALSIAGARVIDREFAVARADLVLAERGDVLEPDAEPRLGELLEALLAEARINAALAA
jgi:chromate reductase